MPRPLAAAAIALALAAAPAAAASPRPVFDLAEHAAACATDHTACLQAAIDAAQAAGGGIVRVPPRADRGCWEIPGRVRVSASGVVIEGDGWASCLHGGIDLRGSGGANTTTTAAPARHDVRIPVVSSEGFVPGGFVHVVGQTPRGGRMTLVSKIERIESAPAPALVLHHPMPIDMTGAPPLDIAGFTPLEGVQVRNLRLTGDGLKSTAEPGAYHGIWATWVARSRFQGLWMSRFDGAAVSAGVGYQNHFADLLDEGSGGRHPPTGDATVAAISLMYQTEASLGGAIRTLAPYGVGIYLGPATYSDFSAAAVSAVRAQGEPLATPGAFAGRGIKLVGVLASFLPTAISLNNPSTGMAITLNSEGNIGPRLITLRNGHQPTGAPDGIGLWHNGQGNRDNIAGPIIIDGSRLAPFELSPTDDDNLFIGLRADGDGRDLARGNRFPR